MALLIDDEAGICREEDGLVGGSAELLIDTHLLQLLPHFPAIGGSLSILVKHLLLCPCLREAL